MKQLKKDLPKPSTSTGIAAKLAKLRTDKRSENPSSTTDKIDQWLIETTEDMKRMHFDEDYRKQIAKRIS